MKAPVFRASVNAAHTRAGSAATKHANARGMGDEARIPSMALMPPALRACERARRIGDFAEGTAGAPRLSMIKRATSVRQSAPSGRQ